MMSTNTHILECRYNNQPGGQNGTIFPVVYSAVMVTTASVSVVFYVSVTVHFRQWFLFRVKKGKRILLY